jgi:hypothetical protein
MSESTKTIYLKNSEAYPAGGLRKLSRLPMEEHERMDGKPKTSSKVLREAFTEIA